MTTPAPVPAEGDATFGAGSLGDPDAKPRRPGHPAPGGKVERALGAVTLAIVITVALLVSAGVIGLLFEFARWAWS